MIFDADWRRLGVHVRWRAIAGMEITLNLQALLDPVRAGAWGRPTAPFVVLRPEVE